MKLKYIPLLLVPVTMIVVTCSENAETKSSKETLNATAALTWKVPVEIADTPNATQNDYYDFGWQTFVAINWPENNAYRGMPDSTLSIGAKDGSGQLLNVVWEAWKEQYEIFKPSAADPGGWNDGFANSAKQLKELRMFSKFDSDIVTDAFDEAFAGPLIDQDSQYVRYEVRTNESEYDYFHNNHYYNADSQMTAVSNNVFAGFPKGNDPLSNSLGSWARFGATEVKASWRVFKAGTAASVIERYFHKKAILLNTDGKRSDTVDIGLTGMHILRLTHSTHATWYWASFEQVDNVQLQKQFGGTLPAHPAFNPGGGTVYQPNGYSYAGSGSNPPKPINVGQPLPTAIPVNISAPPFQQTNPQLDSINMQYNKLLTGTPFQYYQMIGTVNPPVANGPTFTNTAGGYPNVVVNTGQMANTTMETYFVKTNCISCHISGYPQAFPADKSKMDSSSNDQVFSFLLQKAETAAGLSVRERMRMKK